jgi:hypothetical protein
MAPINDSTLRVPICLAGAKLTSTQILEEFGIPPPWTIDRIYKGGKQDILEKQRVRNGMDTFPWLICLILCPLLFVALGHLLLYHVMGTGMFH